MNKYKNCPQCGNELFTNNLHQSQCVMCGWGPSPSIGTAELSKVEVIKNKPLKWKAGVLSSAIILLLVITPVINLISDQFMASKAIATARQQIDKKLYASAAKTLNRAPRAPAASGTKKEINTLLSSSVRWARDTTEVKTAKKAIVEVQPEAALDTLGELEEDFPLEEDAIELIDLAQEQSLDPAVEVSEEIVDDLAPLPDDPELENLENLESEAEEQLAASEPSPASPAPANPAAPAAPESNEDAGPNAEPPEPELEAEEEAEEELPESPDPPNVAPSPEPVAPANKPSHLVPLYQLFWANRPITQQTDQDSFYTIDLANEVNPKKDRKSNFGGYGGETVIGQLYNRKQKGNRNIMPLYRYWSAAKTDHFYTTNRKFSSQNSKANYVRQQVAGYIGKWDGNRCLEGTTPLYNIYNQRVSDNHYTTSVAFKDALIKNHGWTNPRIVGCIW